MKKISMVINSKDKVGFIRPEIYSHFSEHLGRCIYDGIFVGKDSDIPNIDGIRKDIIDAFKQIKVPSVRCQVELLQTNIIGKMELDHKKKEKI